MRTALKWTGIVAAAVVVLAVLIIALLDWNRLRGPIGRFASERSGRTVQILGNLDVRAFSLTPRATVERLRVGNPKWVPGDAPMAEVERLTVEIALLPLFKGEVVLPELIIDRPSLSLIREAGGRANWQTTPARTKPVREEPANLPAVRRFLVRDGRLRVEDQERKLKFAGVVVADESSAAQSRAFKLDGEGELNAKPFELHVVGNSLINVDRDEPYPFEARVRAGDTRLTLQGSIPRPFDLRRYQATVAMSGDDLADLYYLTGLALPNTPPYRVSGKLVRKGTLIDFQNVAGTIGDSDVRGQVTINTGGGRPKIDAHLVSKSLDLDDLAAPLGAPPSIKEGETVSPKEKQLAQAMIAQRRLFPDSRLDLKRVRSMDGSLKFRAESVKARKVPMRKVSADVKLAGGVLTIEPLSFELPQGRMAGKVRLDARKDIPETQFDLHLTGVQLGQFRPKTSNVAPIEGLLLARAQGKGHGNSVHQVVSSANGTVTAVVPRGEIREAFAELTGINVSRGLGLLLTKDQEQIGVRCGVAAFKVENGIMSAQNMVFDTDNVLITGKGNIDLGKETFDLSVKGQPKKLRFLRVRSPVDITGALRKPSIGIEAGKAAAQTGIAAALGAVVAPLAAVIAFVDPGLADDANCGALLAEARKSESDSKKAPFKTATRDSRSMQ